MKNIFCFFVLFCVCNANAQVRLKYEASILLNTDDEYRLKAIGQKLHNSHLYQLSYNNPVLNQIITLLDVNIITSTKKSYNIDLNKSLKYESSNHNEPVIDFDFNGQTLCLLTTKRILLYETNDSLSEFRKKIDWNITSILKKQKINIRKFRNLTFKKSDSINNTILISKDLITNDMQPKICVVKFNIKNYELQSLKYIAHGERLPYKDPFSFYSSTNYTTENHNGTFYSIKNGFYPFLTKLSSELEAIDSFYLNLFDTIINAPLRNIVEAYEKKYMISNTMSNFNSLMGALDSSYFINQIGSLNDDDLIIQIQDPTHEFLFKSYLYTYNQKTLYKIEEDNPINVKVKDIITQENFPIRLLNYPFLTDKNYLYVFIELHSEIVLNQSTFGEVFFKQYGQQSKTYNYLIKYSVIQE